MAPDKKKIHIVSLSALAAILLALFAPVGMGRPLAAVLLLLTAAAACFFIKKRTALSLNSKTVLLIVGTIGLLYLMFYYVSGLRFGFTKTGYGLKADILFRLILPIAAIIAASEILRYVLCAQKDRAASAFAYVICLLGDIVICSNLAGITNFATFMDVIGLTLFPGLLYHLLYNYLSLRYGPWPNLIYRALTVWVFYLIPYGSAVSDSLVAFVNMLLPVAIWFFIDALYEKKRRFALKKVSRFSKAASVLLTVLVLVIMVGTVMLVSNQFRFGALVIATDSMTGELNKGDVALFERYDDQFIAEGQVIVFEQSKSMIVHRVVDIQIVNGNTRYYTKGDANEDPDTGFITDADIVGLVDYKLPFLGFPTLWLRSLFRR